MRVRQRTRVLRVMWAPSRLRRMLRSRVVWAAIALVSSLVGVVNMTTRVAAVEQARIGWGTVEPVVVVTNPIEVGDLIVDNTKVRELPQSMIPPNALRTVPDGARAKVPLFRGEVVLAARASASDDRLPTGSHAVTLPVVVRVPLVNVGDLVDLWLVETPTTQGGRVAQRVMVLELTDDHVTVAVPESQIAQAAAASLRPVTLILVG